MKILLNWKQNGSFGAILNFKNNIKNGDLVLFAPFPYLGFLNSSKFQFGSQNVSQFENGAFTGEVGADILAEIGVKYCLVGHSERRQYFNETESQISSKIKQLKKNNIIPVLCVGENLEERKQGEFLEKIKQQMKVFESGVLLAYEPIWSIGTGIIPKMQEIQDMANFFFLNYGIEMFYGGSVNEKNAKEITKLNNIQGLLVGGASLDVEKVNIIINDTSRN